MTVSVPAPLFSAAQAGDPAALAQLLSLLRPDIRRYARYQCKPSTAIDDVVQEALIVVYRKIGTVRTVAAFGGWLATVVLRLCMLPELLLSRPSEDVAQLANAAEFAERPEHELRLDLVRALESLPAPYREIILMRDMQEMTIREIAGALAVTPEAAKSRLHRARSLMREYLLTAEAPCKA